MRSRSTLDQTFLRYVVGSKEFTDHVRSIITGVNVPHIAGRDIAAFEFTLPPLSIQLQIGKILAAYDDLIEVNQRRIAIVEEMARRLFDEWFVRFRFPGHGKERLVESSLGKVPATWRVEPLSVIVENIKVGTKPGSHLADRRYVPIECISRRSLALGDSMPWQDAQSSLQLFEEGDILFGAMRPYFHKVAIAPFPGVTRSTCFVWRACLPRYRSFAALVAFDDRLVAFATAHSKGSTIPYAQWDGSLSDYRVSVPPTTA